MTTTSERPTTQQQALIDAAKATPAYSKCGQPADVSSGCGRRLTTIEEQQRGICADFPMC